MNTFKKLLFLAIPLAIAAYVASPAQAYFYQPQYQPNYVQGFSQPQVYVPAYYPQPYYYNPYPYGYGQPDTVRNLTQGLLNFTAQFTYIPGPVHPYFYTYYQQPYGY